ncbi:hypothetical protein [Bacillus alveayuensis]|jgi:hypothetical protein|nr:hypothetical protein [Bacillus alveayuensis]
MRNMSFDEVKHLINDKKHSIDYEVNKYITKVVKYQPSKKVY